MTKRKSDYEAVLRAPVTGRRLQPIVAVAIRVGKSVSTIERYEKLPDLGFPKSVQIVPGGPRLYYEDEIDAFIAHQAAQPRLPRASNKHTPPPPQRKSDLTAAYAGEDAGTAPATADRHTPASQKPIGRPGAGPALIARPTQR